MTPGEHGGHAPRNDLLLVDPDAIPQLRGAFADALARVDEQLTLAEHDLRIAAWAADPVSRDAATEFNERSVDTASSALDSLRAYREQLSTAVSNLDRTAEQYEALETDGSGAANASGA